MKHLLSSAAKAAVVCLTLVWSARAQNSGELSNLSVEDLMKVEVTSVARRGQRLSDTPAATFVITQEDIRRSGATNIPDLLRMVPGFDVSQIDQSVWGVSARGFNGRWANKLLVLIDGRSVYTPVFSGVRWDVQNVPVEDIDHIEVTRGPGGTLWGANAMNGIVNIITKRPIDAQGTVASFADGSATGPSAMVRYGGRLGENGHYRTTLSGFHIPASERLAGSPGGNDDWKSLRGGFRAEWTQKSGVMNLQGDVYSGNSGETIMLPTDADPWGTARNAPNAFHGHDLLFRWSATQSPRSETTLLAYYDEAARHQSSMTDRVRTLDVDFAHHVTLGHHNATWGAEARAIEYATGSDDGSVRLLPPDGRSTLVTAFLQDEVRVSSKLTLTLGSKLLHSVDDDGNRTSLQPSVRARWNLRDNQVLWAAGTHAVRDPSVFENDSFMRTAAFPDKDGNPVTLALVGGIALAPERMTSWEIGYRGVVSPSVSLDVTAYRNEFRELVNQVTAAPAIENGQPILPSYFQNTLAGRSKGIEALITVRPARRWDVVAGYTLFSLHLIDSGDGVASDDLRSADAPRHQYSLRSYFTVSPRMEIDAAAYFVGGIASQGVPRYRRTDLRAGWQLASGFELSLAGRNLTNDGHTEYNGISEQAAITPVSRTITATLLWRH